MRNVRISLLLFLLSAGFAGKAQDNEVILQYIATYKEMAVAEMQRTGVPASITLAQGIHETTAGTSVLVRKSNNHFGIKCKSNWSGESVSHDDDARGECFRKYDNPFDSYRDHSDFLKNGARYAFLFRLDPLDYKDWAYGLKKAGYATNPRYPQIIVKLIEDYQLQDYTLIAMGKMSPGDDAMARHMVKENPVEPVAAAVVEQNISLPEAIAVEDPAYPFGEFRINETRVVYVCRGISLLSVAQQYNIPLARIFEFNEIEETEILEKSQLLYLQRKRKTGQNEFHVVKAGETLHDIAQQEGIRLESLLGYNALGMQSRPAVGTQLYLNRKAAGEGRSGSVVNE